MTPKTTIEDFTARAQAILGGRGWQAAFARQTGISSSTIRRWGPFVPDYAAATLELLEACPRERWPERWK